MNTSLLNYFIEANLGLILFYASYYLLLKNETQFSYRRYYLLAGIILSLLFPLLHFAEFQSVPSLSETLPLIQLNDVPLVAAPSEHTRTWDVTQLLTVIYLTVTLVFALRLLYQVVVLLRLIRLFPAKTVIELPASSFLAFSFFNRIFISTAYPLSERDKEKILKHEEVHRKKLHSLDILLVELVRIFFWFNPILLSYRKEIAQVHEFEADEAAASHAEQDQYCELLARAALQSAGYGLGNHFNNSLTLKRIAMIRTVKKNIRKWKVLTIFLFTSALFIIISCRDQVMEEMQQEIQTTTIAGDFPDHLKPVVVRLQQEYPGLKIVYVEIDALAAEKLKEISPGDILYINMAGNPNDQQGDRRVEMLVRADGALQKLSANATTNDEVYLVAEEPAAPQGGLTAFYEAIQKELKYPGEAMRNGVMGKVFIEFVVEKDGSLSNHRIVKGIGVGCDEEALRALKTINIPWNPARNRGEVVRSKIVVPVTFKLDNPPATITGASAPVSEQQSKTFLIVEQPPSPEGGMEAFYRELARIITVPAQTRRNGVEGKILIEFVVETDGTTSGHRLMKGIDPAADQAALDALKSVNLKWNPGTQRGTPVRTSMVIPITIKNENKELDRP
jgi:TonB family protein